MAPPQLVRGELLLRRQDDTPVADERRAAPDGVLHLLPPGLEDQFHHEGHARDGGGDLGPPRAARLQDRAVLRDRRTSAGAHLDYLAREVDVRHGGREAADDDVQQARALRRARTPAPGEEPDARAVKGTVELREPRPHLIADAPRPGEADALQPEQPVQADPERRAPARRPSVEDAVTEEDPGWVALRDVAEIAVDADDGRLLRQPLLHG
jgi:hypothetical protein